MESQTKRATPVAEESTNNEYAENSELLDTENGRRVEIDKIKCLSPKQDLVRYGTSGEKDIDNTNRDNARDDDKAFQEDASKENTLLQDQGWAWMIVLGSFLSHIIIGGFERSDGVLFVRFTELFQESAQMTAWPGSLCSTIRLVMGPVASAVSNRFSARASVMIGTFIFALGLVISGFARNVTYLIFSFGLLQGLGRGLVYAPILIIVGMYFNRFRGFGVGLSTAGVGLGTFIFPPLVDLLFERYGFQSAFLIMGGLALNLCIAGALFRPLSTHRNIVLGIRNVPLSTRKENVVMPSQFRTEVNSQPNITSRHQPIATQKTTAPTSETMHVVWSKTTEEINSANIVSTRTLSSTKPSRRGGTCLKSILKTCLPVDESKETSSKKSLVEWGLLRNVPFLFFCFSICLFTAAFKSAFTFLPSLANGKGVTISEGAYLLSVSGILDTLGRILTGVILDLKCVKPFRPIVYNGVVFVIAILSFLSPFLTNFVEFALLFGLYGVLTGAYVSQKSVILVDILGQEKLGSSFGLMICFQGLGTFIGPPVSGVLRDAYGRFDEAFYLGGASMAVAGCLMVISNIYLIIIRRRSQRASVNKINQSPG